MPVLDAEKGVIRLVIFVHVTITYNIRKGKGGDHIGGGWGRNFEENENCY